MKKRKADEYDEYNQLIKDLSHMDNKRVKILTAAQELDKNQDKDRAQDIITNMGIFLNEISNVSVEHKLIQYKDHYIIEFTDITPNSIIDIKDIRSVIKVGDKWVKDIMFKLRQQGEQYDKLLNISIIVAKQDSKYEHKYKHTLKRQEITVDTKQKLMDIYKQAKTEKDGLSAFPSSFIDDIIDIDKLSHMIHNASDLVPNLDVSFDILDTDQYMLQFTGIHELEYSFVCKIFKTFAISNIQLKASSLSERVLIITMNPKTKPKMDGDIELVYLMTS